MIAAYLVLHRRPLGERGDARRRRRAGRARRRESPSPCRASRATASRHATRWHDGLIFGAVLLAGAGAAACSRRAPRPRDTPALRRGARRSGRAGARRLVAVVGVLKAGVVRQRHVRREQRAAGSARARPTFADRLVASGLATGGRSDKLTGTGGGTFHLTNLRFRRLVPRRDDRAARACPCSSCPRPAWSASCSSSPPCRRSCCAASCAGAGAGARARARPARVPGPLAVDIDWDFAAVSVPAFLVAGALVGRGRSGACPPFATVAAAGVAALAIGVLVLPWLGNRWATDASGRSPARAITLAKRAESVDPLLVEPLWAKAFAAELQPPAARVRLLRSAVRRQPKNPQTWLLAGRFAFDRAATRPPTPTSRVHGARQQGASRARAATTTTPALRMVNAGKGRC